MRHTGAIWPIGLLLRPPLGRPGDFSRLNTGPGMLRSIDATPRAPGGGGFLRWQQADLRWNAVDTTFTASHLQEINFRSRLQDYAAYGLPSCPSFPSIVSRHLTR